VPLVRGTRNGMMKEICLVLGIMVKMLYNPGLWRSVCRALYKLN